MLPTTLLLVASALGVDYGWQPIAGGGVEYMIQIRPDMIEAMKDGEALFSDLPLTHEGIRRYRITVGQGPLPHQGEPLPPPPTPALTSTSGFGPELRPATGGAPTIRANQPAEDPMVRLAGGPSVPFSSGAKITSKPTISFEPQSPSDQTSNRVVAATEAPKQWVPLTLTLMGLFVSLGANLYLAFVTWGLYGRCRRLLDQLLAGERFGLE